MTGTAGLHDGHARHDLIERRLPNRCGRDEDVSTGATNRSGPAEQRPGLGGANDEIVKVATHLESTGLFDPTDLHRLEAGRSDQPLDLLAGTIVVGRVEEHRGLR